MMIFRILFCIVCLCISARLSRADIILQWNTFGNSGTETSEPSIFNHASFSASNLTLGAGVTASTNGDRFGGNRWFDTGDTSSGTTLAESIAGNDYLQFVVSPNVGIAFTPTSFVFSWERSGTGPSSVTLRSSFDGFASDLGSINSLPTNLTIANSISITGLTALGAETTFRLYGYGATGTTGSGGFDTDSNTPNVTFNGTITAVPEPTSLLLVSAAGCVPLILKRIRRKRFTHAKRRTQRLPCKKH